MIFEKRDDVVEEAEFDYCMIESLTLASREDTFPLKSFFPFLLNFRQNDDAVEKTEAVVSAGLWRRPISASLGEPP